MDTICATLSQNSCEAIVAALCKKIFIRYILSDGLTLKAGHLLPPYSRLRRRLGDATGGKHGEKMEDSVSLCPDGGHCQLWGFCHPRPHPHLHWQWDR